MGGRKDSRSKIVDKSFEVPAAPPQGFLSKDYFLSCFAFEKHDRKCQLNNFFHGNLKDFSINSKFYEKCAVLYELRTSLPTLQTHPDANCIAGCLMIQANWKTFPWIALFGLNPMTGEGLINSIMGTNRLLLPIDTKGSKSLPDYSADDFLEICQEVIMRLKENFSLAENKVEIPAQADEQLFCTLLTSPRVERWMAASNTKEGIFDQKAIGDYSFEVIKIENKGSKSTSSLTEKYQLPADKRG